MDARKQLVPVPVPVLVAHIVIPAILTIIQVKNVARTVHRIIIQARMELKLLAAMHRAHILVTVVLSLLSIKSVHKLFAPFLGTEIIKAENVLNFHMKTNKENQQKKSPGKSKEQPKKGNKSIVKDTDADGSSPYVDLDKSNFTERTHGRTTKSLGPDHEPGTV